ncbi:Bacillopeptidase F [Orchesella cincta]|uniref:Bacillopeptidase F n=1 Tax=Orchesella cincta TaxID=48709 RepID=A0A1D2M163_ORCCI|nr:Bacillopeptidase F [Orchesella cincta]
MGSVKIQAPEAWQELGTLSGEGVIIATVDTGVRGTHEALKDNFVGEYGWFDPSTSTPEPTDNNGHGTHTTGTIAGGKGIGVAPGAKWAACRGCASSACWQSDLLACGDFFACPLVLMDPAQTAAKPQMSFPTPGEVVEETPGTMKSLRDGMRLKSSHFSPTETLDQVATLPTLLLTKMSLL